MAVTNELIGAGMPALQASLLGNGNAVNSTYNGLGILPSSQSPAGFEITSNYGGFGEVDFWSLVNSNNNQGFYFKQKTAAGIALDVAQIYYTSTGSNIQVTFGDNFFGFLTSATEAAFFALPSIPINFYGGASGDTLFGSFTAAGRFVLPISVTPSAANAAGVTGTIAWDSGFIYVCVTTNTWKRVAIATWP